MSEAIPQAEFSSTSSTIILTEPLFSEIKEKIKRLGWWNANFEIIEKEMQFCAFESYPAIK